MFGTLHNLRSLLTTNFHLWQSALPETPKEVRRTYPNTKLYQNQTIQTTHKETSASNLISHSSNRVMVIAMVMVECMVMISWWWWVMAKLMIMGVVVCVPVRWVGASILRKQSHTPRIRVHGDGRSKRSWLLRYGCVCSGDGMGRGRREGREQITLRCWWWRWNKGRG